MEKIIRFNKANSHFVIECKFYIENMILQKNIKDAFEMSALLDFPFSSNNNVL